MRIGWIGLGEIGAPMAWRVHEAGHDLTVWNRTDAKAGPFGSAGVPVATSVVDLASDCDVVLTCLDTAAALHEVLLGPDGVVTASRPPRVVVDTSTVHPDTTRDLALGLAAAGTACVDAPVSGGPRGAAAGTLAVFVGGAAEDVALVRPVLSAFAGTLTHLGPLGSGQVGKLCNQLVNFTTMAAIAEATALGASYGLDDAALPAAMSGGLADSAMLREYARGRAAHESTNITGIVNGLRGLLTDADGGPAGGRVDILLKDLGAALDVARAHHCALPVSGALEGVYRMLSLRERG